MRAIGQAKPTGVEAGVPASHLMQELVPLSVPSGSFDGPPNWGGIVSAPKPIALAPLGKTEQAFCNNHWVSPRQSLPDMAGTCFAAIRPLSLPGVDQDD